MAYIKKVVSDVAKRGKIIICWGNSHNSNLAVNDTKKELLEVLISSEIKSFQLVAGNILNETEGTVNKYGVVTAVREGNATITAKTSSKKTAKCAVTVKKNLSEKEISDLIVKNCLSEETVEKMITDNAITESQVLVRIKQNSLSQDDVRKIIAVNSGSSSGSSDYHSNNEWKNIP